MNLDLTLLLLRQDLSQETAFLYMHKKGFPREAGSRL